MNEILPIVMNSNFERLAVIDDYTSFIWTTRYYTCGDFELCVDVSAESIGLFQKDYFIVRDDDEHIGIVENIKIQRNEDGQELLIVSGRFLSSIIGRRIISKQTIVSGNVSDCIYTLLDNEIINPSIVERQIPNFTHGTYETTAKMEAQYTGKNLLDTISAICETYGVGFKTLLTDQNDFEFNLFEGVDRSYEQIVNPYVVFSDQYDNLLSSEYEENYQSIATNVLVAGEGEGLDRKTLWVTRGYEIISDNILNSSDVSNYGLTNYSYSDGIWTGTHAARTHGLKITTVNLLTAGKTYTFKYKFQKTGGTLVKIGGHNAGFTQLDFTVDGQMGDSYDTGYAMADDTKIHEVVYTGSFDGDVSDNNFYIQPNRLNDTTVSVKIWDIEVFESEPVSGLNRYEVYKDARNLQSNDGEISDAEYQAQMREDGLESITTFTTAFTGTVYFGNLVWKQDVNIGDICTIENSRWGIYINSRLVEVIESVSESGEYSIIPTFGL